ncbi:hypothetical protein [Halorussus halophilus]|uniref:hypothetical protein n=1 Tax=Halorussus halophilus TaxID=2650975 RepID=UPI0013015079|nr:hypothetical protein [Halorussus halophilus]
MSSGSERYSNSFDDEIPTADSERAYRRTIEDSGWWRAHFLVLATGVFVITLGVFLLALVWLSSYGSTLYWTSANLLGYVVWGSFVVFMGSSFASLYGYYAEAKILRESNADWQPH